VRYEQVNAMLPQMSSSKNIAKCRTRSQDRRTRSQDRATAKDFQSKFGEQEKQIAAPDIGLQKVNARILVSKPEPAWPPTITENHN